MRFKRTVLLLMMIMMLFALLSLPVAATIGTDTIMYYLRLDYNTEGGSIYLDGVYSAPETYNCCSGTSIDITITPNDGYVIKSITSEKRWPIYVTDIITDFITTQSYCMSKKMYCNRVITVEFAKTCCTAAALASPPEGGTATVNGEASITAAAGTEVVFQAEPNSDDGYYFDGWYDGDSCVSTDTVYSFQILSDTTLTAVFEKDDVSLWQLTIDTIGEGTATGEGVYEDETYVEVNAYPDDGWYFEGWYTRLPVLEAYSLAEGHEDDGLVLVSTDNPYGFTISEDTLLVAVFKQRLYEVSIEIIGKGTVTGAGTYAHGQYLDLNAAPESGWRFENWYYQGEVFNPVDYRVTTDMAITARFVEDQKTDPKPRPRPGPSEVTRYQLNISVEGPGSVLPEPGTHSYEKGMTVVLVPTPESGAIFLGWSGEDGGDVVNDTVLMDKDKAIIARFGTIEEEQPPAESEQEPIPEEVITTILDDEIPISGQVLPQTGGFPAFVFYIAGGVCILAAIVLTTRTSKENSAG